ncbi:cysteine desulfurase family protein [Gracilibacillus sp. YIM 98692]|uniref:cysteine desulfurase family protein n=1 Tax=Gracilibacillus sp. YIM 98692 TaxID=2663532 RepID=UPI0013D8777D|nr:cysteine desulfurase family protein [Gracilibacillus sp. YIM 98692]
MIYLDNSATTKPDEQVLNSFQQAASQYFGNPSSIHGLGKDAERLLRKAREQAADILGVNSLEIIFTSGGTEGNNMAIKGIALEHQSRGKHIITSVVEHPSVLEACTALEEIGFRVTYLPVDRDGRVNLTDLKEAISEETILVSIMHVNNEIGTVQPIEEIARILKDYPKAFFHVDHVQGFGKAPLDLSNLGVDLCTISGHKIHGLKGTGLLYARRGVRLFSLSHGGGQENNLRSGTENVPGIVAFVKAMRIMEEARLKKLPHLQQLQNWLIDRLETIDQLVVNTPSETKVPHIVHFSAPGLKPEVVIHALEEFQIYISTKSACSSKSADESAVLAACGKTEEVTKSGLRVSMSYQTTWEEVQYFFEKIKHVITNLSQVMR